MPHYRAHSVSLDFDSRTYFCGVMVADGYDTTVVLLADLNPDPGAIFEALAAGFATKIRRAFLSNTAPDRITWLVRFAAAINISWLQMRWDDGAYTLPSSLSDIDAGFWMSQFGTTEPPWPTPNFALMRHLQNSPS